MGLLFLSAPPPPRANVGVSKPLLTFYARQGVPNVTQRITLSSQDNAWAKQQSQILMIFDEVVTSRKENIPSSSVVSNTFYAWSTNSV